MPLLTSATLGAFSGGVSSYAASYDALGHRWWASLVGMDGAPILRLFPQLIL
ncbi:MAG TPA: hypothetical protein VF725_03655 [Ktedonobacterales bacterium]